VRKMADRPFTIVALMGSPRRKNTLRLVEIIVDEMNKLGPVNVEYVFLAERHIEPCRGCMQCLAKGWDHCPIQDDMSGIMTRIGEGDGVILASPVYVYHVTAQTKTFLDRLASFCHRPAFFMKHAMAVATTGAVGTRPTLKYMKSILGVLGFRTVVAVGGAGQDMEGRIPARLEEKARKAARRFHENLVKGASIQPSLSSVIQFRMQRRAFTTKDAAKIFPKDFEHYTSLKGRPYPVEARISLLKLLVAGLTERIVGRFIGLT